MTMNRPGMLDLFSGIGGFSLAFHPLFKTVAYCEKDTHVCTEILRKNMKLGLIDQAPIFHDVTKLNPERDLLQSMASIRVVTAGFPCQDISASSSTHAGIHGSRSSLFFHIVRICEALPDVAVVVLENSNLIVSYGLDVVVKELCERLGFVLFWSVHQVQDVGGWQSRARWVACAVRDFAFFDKHVMQRVGPLQQSTMMAVRRKFVQQVWPEQLARRVVPRSTFVTSTDATVNRLRVLGNSLVPQVIWWALLLTCSSVSAFAASAPPRLKDAKHDNSNSPQGTDDRIRRVHGARHVQDLKGATRRNVIVTTQVRGKLTHFKVKKPVYVQTPMLNVRLADLSGGSYIVRYWGTPRYSNWSWLIHRKLGRRNVSDLTNQLFHALPISVQREMLAKLPKGNATSMSVYTCDPRFVERLMGYPRDYTKKMIG